MHTSSLFSRVSRYVRREFVDPGENRLTEVLAAVLERVPGLARALAVSWLDPDQHHAGRRERAASIGDVWDRIKILPVDVIPRVRTQVALAGRFVDLELRFALEGGARADDVVVLVEVKHGIEPHGGQLAAYRDALASMECQGAVVLLDHRRKLPYTDPAQVPAEVAQRSWESTGREIQRFPSPDGVSAWLCEELLTYLQEESLMDPTALGPEHLTALAYEGQAHAALAEICARAEGHVARLFAEPNRSAKRYGKGYEARWPRITTSTRDSEYAPWPEWHILANAEIGRAHV